MEIRKAVITGGPGGGKSTSLKYIKDHFRKKGIHVITVGETATELIGGGVAPWTCGTPFEYQKAQIMLQIKKEEIIEQAALTMKFDRTLIVFDRGLMDNKAYMTDEEFDSIIGMYGLTEEDVLKRYDGIFHLETAAKGIPDMYTLMNNDARTEGIEDAVRLDMRTKRAWEGHPFHKVIKGKADLEEKIKELLSLMDELYR